MLRYWLDDTYERIDAHLAQFEWRVEAYAYARRIKRSRRQAIRWFLNPSLRIQHMRRNWNGRSVIIPIRRSVPPNDTAS